MLTNKDRRTLLKNLSLSIHDMLSSYSLEESKLKNLETNLRTSSTMLQSVYSSKIKEYITELDEIKNELKLSLKHINEDGFYSDIKYVTDSNLALKLTTVEGQSVEDGLKELVSFSMAFFNEQIIKTIAEMLNTPVVHSCDDFLNILYAITNYIKTSNKFTNYEVMEGNEKRTLCFSDDYIGSNVFGIVLQKPTTVSYDKYIMVVNNIDGFTLSGEVKESDLKTMVKKDLIDFINSTITLITMYVDYLTLSINREYSYDSLFKGMPMFKNTEESIGLEEGKIRLSLIQCKELDIKRGQAYEIGTMLNELKLMPVADLYIIEKTVESLKAALQYVKRH